MKVGSLFSGVGGFDKGLEDAGFQIAWQVERDPFARRVLAKNWPHVTCGDDVREWPSDRHEPIDLLVGGFPCQDLSVAGKRAGLAGERSVLFHEFIRIAKTLQPTWGLVENVPGLFSSHAGRDMATVLEGLRECWPVVGYRVLDSRYWGVAQRRRRVFFVGGPSEQCVEQVLFESQGSSGNFTTSEEARTDVASSLRSRSHRPGINPPGRGGEDDMNLVVAATLNCSGQQGGFSPEPGEHIVVTHSLRAEGFDASEDGTGRGTPIVAVSANQRRELRTRPVHGSLNSTKSGKQFDGVLANGVRRLTPTECERLQGFEDGWTCLCQPLEQYDSMKCKCPDGPRYKTLGNAVTVPVIRWIGRMILASQP
jgi:DNA (cytosine-5)-methyltransferase 1